MPPAKTTPDQPEDAYLRTLIALQETVKESQTHVRESSEALIEAHRASLEQLAERLIEAMSKSAAERIEVVVQPPAPGADDVSDAVEAISRSSPRAAAREAGHLPAELP